MELVQNLLASESADDPCGPNLEYDRAFTELDRIARVKPEQQIGSVIKPAEEPDWRDVETRSAALLERSKDLRVAVHLAKAMLRTRALAGFAAALGLIQDYVERFWEGVHPRLDPDDDNDPTMRTNALSDLAGAETTLAWLRMTPIVEVRGIGRFTLRDVQIARGETPPPAGMEQPPAMSSIEAAFNAVELPDLLATLNGARSALEHAKGIENAFNEKVGPGQGPSFAKLRGMLHDMIKVLEPAHAARAPVSEASPEPKPANGAEGSSTAPAAKPLTGEINSREDVVRALDKIKAYYERNEPSSPIPILIQRCKRLVTMDFMQIVRDVAPDAVSQVEALRGRLEEPPS